MGETTYSIGEFPGHEFLSKILDEGPMPDKPGGEGAAITRNQLDRFIGAVQQILRDCRYPTTSMELDALVDEDNDDLAMRFTLLLRLAHRTRSAWYAGEMGKFGHYVGQLAKVTAEAKYYERLPYTISGMKSYVGAKKSAMKRAKLKRLKPSHDAILREGKNMLAIGYGLSEITSRIHRKYSRRDGFPSSIRQYSSISKPLRVTTNRKKTEA
jgi:hypothetical protein